MLPKRAEEDTDELLSPRAKNHARLVLQDSRVTSSRLAATERFLSSPSERQTIIMIIISLTPVSMLNKLENRLNE